VAGCAMDACGDQRNEEMSLITEQFVAVHMIGVVISITANGKSEIGEICNK